MNTFNFAGYAYWDSAEDCADFLKNLTPVKRLMLRNVQWGECDGGLLNCQLHLFGLQKACCGEAAKKGMAELQECIAREGIVLRDGALKVGLQCSKDGEDEVREYMSDVSASRFMHCCK